MTAPTETQAPAPGAQIDANKQTIPGQGIGAENGSEGTKPPREQRYRLERNQARAERDALATRLEQLQTAELHRQAGEFLAVAGDIELSGKSLADFLTPEGWVDREAVATVAEAVIAARPGLAKNPRVAATDPTQGHGGAPGRGKPLWVDIFRN